MCCYKTGDRVTLAEIGRVWHEKTVVVLRLITVTITDVKTGVSTPGSEDLWSLQSILATDGDGNVYEKHWREFPGVSYEVDIEWTERADGMLRTPWRPVEIFRFHNRYAACGMGEVPRITFLDSAGDEWTFDAHDLGGATYCSAHDRFVCPGDEVCPGCEAELRGGPVNGPECDAACGM